MISLKVYQIERLEALEVDVFKVKGNSLEPIAKNAFKLEKDIQSLVEDNLEVLFDLEFVNTEFSVGDFRLDTLAFDNASSSFVIIEYKKGSSYSVVDQGYSYLSAMLNNKAEFILEYNEKSEGSLKRSEIDWSGSRVIFVSPSFNTYQRNSVNFKDVPFELWEIRRYEQGLVALENIQSSSRESIESITPTDKQSVISKVSEEIKTKTEEEHLSNLSDELTEVWGTLKEKLESYPDTAFKSTGGYISWNRNNTGVCFIHFQRKGLRIDILRGNEKVGGEKSKNYFTFDDPKELAKDRNWTWKSGEKGHAYTFHLRKLEEMDYAMFLIEQKYNTLD